MEEQQESLRREGGLESWLAITGKVGFDATIWFTAASIVAFIAEYLYERSYCNYFAIPTSFIEVDLSKLVIVFFAFVMAIGLVEMILLLSNPFRKLLRLHPIFWFSIKKVSVPIAGCILLSWAIGYWYVGASLALAFSTEFLYPLFFGNKNLSYTQRMIVSQIGDSNPEHLEIRFMRRMGAKVNSLLMLCMFIVGFSGIIGLGSARNKSDFMRIDLPESPSDKAVNRNLVLAKYGDRFVCVDADSMNQIVAGFSLISCDRVANTVGARITKVRLNNVKTATSIP